MLQQPGEALLRRVERPHRPRAPRPLRLPLVHERDDRRRREPRLHEERERAAEQRAALEVVGTCCWSDMAAAAGASAVAARAGVGVRRREPNSSRRRVELRDLREMARANGRRCRGAGLLDAAVASADAESGRRLRRRKFRWPRSRRTQAAAIAAGATFRRGARRRRRRQGAGARGAGRVAAQAARARARGAEEGVEADGAPRAVAAARGADAGGARGADRGRARRARRRLRGDGGAVGGGGGGAGGRAARGARPVVRRAHERARAQLGCSASSALLRWAPTAAPPRTVSLHSPASRSPGGVAHLPGGDHLRWKVHRLDERVEERFPPASLTFLTPDAPDVLGALDPARVYVIGGLVDRSVQKAALVARARGLGAATARLRARGALGDPPRRARAAHARRRADDAARVQCERRLGPRDHGRAARAQAGAPARGGRALGAKEEGRQLELGRAAARGRRRRRRRARRRGRRREKRLVKIGSTPPSSHRRNGIPAANIGRSTSSCPPPCRPP